MPYFGQVSADGIYMHKIKPLRRYLDALRTTLNGKYANFAIFGLVGDNSFEKCVKLGSDMLLCVTDAELSVGLMKSSRFLAVVLFRASLNWAGLISHFWRFSLRTTWSFSVPWTHQYFDVFSMPLLSVWTL